MIPHRKRTPRRVPRTGPVIEPVALARFENEGGPAAAAAGLVPLPAPAPPSSSMPPATPEEEKRFTQDLKRIDELPARTKELLLLKDQAEKSTGGESLVLNIKIRNKSRS